MRKVAVSSGADAMEETKGVAGRGGNRSAKVGPEWSRGGRETASIFGKGGVDSFTSRLKLGICAGELASTLRVGGRMAGFSDENCGV